MCLSEPHMCSLASAGLIVGWNKGIIPFASMGLEAEVHPSYSCHCSALKTKLNEHGCKEAHSGLKRWLTFPEWTESILKGEILISHRGQVMQLTVWWMNHMHLSTQITPLYFGLQTLAGVTLSVSAVQRTTVPARSLAWQKTLSTCRWKKEARFTTCCSLLQLWNVT